MDPSFFLTLGITGFGVAFLHAAIPTHWLPFVVVGRARKWSHQRIVGAILLAGSGHLLTTTALGLAVAYLGFELDHRLEEGFRWLVALILITLGGWLALSNSRRQIEPETRSTDRPSRSDRATLWALFLTLSLSPCELLLPVYLTATPYGWSGVLWLSTVLAVATLGGMILLTSLALKGAAHFAWLDQPNRRLTGLLLGILGVASIALHTH